MQQSDEVANRLAAIGEAASAASPAAAGASAPGTGMVIFGWVFLVAAGGLLWWALAFDTTVRVPAYREALHDIDPGKYPLPSAFNNIGLLQKQMMIFLAAGFAAIAGVLLCVGGAVVGAVAVAREGRP